MIPLFLPGPSGAIFVSLYPAQCSSLDNKWVLHLPAFAEEMNKSRKMVSSQARELSQRGVTVVIPDLYGTGDSAGDYRDANWQAWRDDLGYLIQWIQSQGAESITFWGLRLGCLLALDAVNEFKGQVKELMFWQPVQGGKQYMTQFLRLRMAAGMFKGEQETVGELREKSKGGETLEVAGYDISPRMLDHTEQLSLQDLVIPQDIKVTLFEVVSNKGKALSPVMRKAVESWAETGIEVDASTVSGDPFWTTQEISMAPELLRRTTEALALQSHSYTSLEHADQGSTAEYIADHGEKPFIFSCNKEELAGILHKSDQPTARGVLLVVGGPQYRVGSHRQFVLLARDLAETGIPVFRFDYRGMGDSSGSLAGFDSINEDIGAAIDAFQSACPGVEEVVVWGLCDAATAAGFYAPNDSRVSGLVLLNPWVHSAEGAAKAVLKHYYFQRLFSKGLWSKILKGDFDISKSLASLVAIVRGATGNRKTDAANQEKQANSGSQSADLTERLFRGLQKFQGKVLFILSGNDLTASEFEDSVNASRRFRRLIKGNRFTIQRLEEADHTFSRRIWRDAVSSLTGRWIQSL
ncbi:MAG: hydrolase 1, exosortase A system-associated [Sedimenticola sp.]